MKPRSIAMRVLLMGALVTLFGCAAFQKMGLVGKTPMQQFYEVSGYVQIAEDACNSYADLPTARREVVLACAQAADEAHTQREAAVQAIMGCSMRRVSGGPDAACPEQDEALKLASAELTRLRELIVAALPADRRPK